MRRGAGSQVNAAGQLKVQIDFASYSNIGNGTQRLDQGSNIINPNWACEEVGARCLLAWPMLLVVHELVWAPSQPSVIAVGILKFGMF